MKFHLLFLLVALVAAFVSNTKAEDGNEIDEGQVQLQEYDVLDMPPGHNLDLPEAFPGARRTCVRVRCRIYPRPIICWCIQWA
ncbi:UNVERIFIED_CONTAM: hypothetical protein PYX00_000189 [Menopon gallinae]|uniref:Uncharacterized protein n=1 Tax=Menopon gallinae TaxID=328185 RepID=A0AAW2I905_9NEOP